jgi:hypothetical protein
LGVLGEEARIFLFFLFLLALASLKELSEINKPLVLEHLLERLVFRKEECCLSYWNTKISKGNISISVHSGHFLKALFSPNPCDSFVQGGKNGKGRSSIFPGLRVVAELQINCSVWGFNLSPGQFIRSIGHKSLAS